MKNLLASACKVWLINNTVLTKTEKLSFSKLQDLKYLQIQRQVLNDCENRVIFVIDGNFARRLSFVNKNKKSSASHYIKTSFVDLAKKLTTMAKIFTLRSSLASIINKYGLNVNRKNILECRSLLYLRKDGMTNVPHRIPTSLSRKVSFGIQSMVWSLSNSIIQFQCVGKSCISPGIFGCDETYQKVFATNNSHKQ